MLKESSFISSVFLNFKFSYYDIAQQKLYNYLATVTNICAPPLSDSVKIKIENFLKCFIVTCHLADFSLHAFILKICILRVHRYKIETREK